MALNSAETAPSDWAHEASGTARTSISKRRAMAVGLFQATAFRTRPDQRITLLLSVEQALCAKRVTSTRAL
jgi:hypothetical protein